ncbi:hypothetical protein EGW08_015636 [Elysia chlorotica]|uniref:Reverse transcriptase zinc-binding domain-containing protein n=1 Tax=Elysia chlorotica TaxID=188477 RepID=A0A433T4Y3_ELYCH|nr:hypothetical protein EGW08_015636 [Elysia chlorotica]
MWMYRRMNRISWKDKVTNKEVLDKVGMQKPELLQLIQRRKLAYYGHIRRHCSIQKRVVEGKVEGKRGRGRKRQSWLANIQETSQIRLSVACEAALDRGRWRRMTAHLGDGTAQRTQHITLNFHMNRLNAEHTPLCPLCDDSLETVEHTLFQCPSLSQPRQHFFPMRPDLQTAQRSYRELLPFSSWP